MSAVLGVLLGILAVVAVADPPHCHDLSGTWCCLNTTVVQEGAAIRSNGSYGTGVGYIDGRDVWLEVTYASGGRPPENFTGVLSDDCRTVRWMDGHDWVLGAHRYPYNWSDPVPEGAPPLSADFAGLFFTGRWTSYAELRGVRADTWFPSMLSPGFYVSSLTDGDIRTSNWTLGCMSSQESPGGCFASLCGNDPFSFEVGCDGIHGNISYDLGIAHGTYPTGFVATGGALFYGVYGIWSDDCNCTDIPGCETNSPHCRDGPLLGFITSVDNGTTWDRHPDQFSPSRPLLEPYREPFQYRIMQPYAVTGMEDDGFTYFVSYGCGGSATNTSDPCGWMWGNEIYLVRAKLTPSTVNDASSWQFYAGAADGGAPKWSSSISDIEPILAWHNHVGVTTAAYNKALGRYIMAVGTAPYGNEVNYDTYILEAEHLYGPWKLVTYMRGFGTQAYFVNMLPEFFSDGGHTIQLLYSPEWRCSAAICQRDPPVGTYGLNVVEARLLPRLA